eukprot:TRINITY_DN63489_c0_g1_i1.p1 TRINITY_DN63489_c0_g1~~TRINITY_DN63489_c0_g1_i1.p1  ORF type:complete len:115 (+),score=11.07 TRINITY_DN63489_c0_g1_i1:97-441(+)
MGEFSQMGQGPFKTMLHPEMNYGYGISGDIPYNFTGASGAGQGKTVHHPEMNYGPGVSGYLNSEQALHTRSQQDPTSEKKEKPQVSKRVPGRGQVVTVDERVIDGWQRRRERTR